MNTISFFVLNIFINSLLSFLTALILIEGIIFLFQIPKGRASAFMRMIPILKLPFDLWLYDFSRWSYMHGVNPLDCPEGTRTMSAMVILAKQGANYFFSPITSVIEFTAPSNMTFTLADLLGYTIPSYCLNLLTLVFIIASIIILSKRLISHYHALKFLQTLNKNARCVSLKSTNAMLINCQRKYHFKILSAPSFIKSPFVAGLFHSKIYIPKQLAATLSNTEYDAVLAHELEHIRYKDSLVRLLLDLIEFIFWWVPTNWLHKRIEEDQEIDCDLKCRKYNIQPEDLATAIFKSINYAVSRASCVPHIFANHLTSSTVYKRLKFLEQPVMLRFKKIRAFFLVSAVGIVFFVVLLGRFWIF